MCSRACQPLPPPPRPAACMALPSKSPSPDPPASPCLTGQSIFLEPQIFVSGPLGLRAGKESRILASSMAQRWPKTLLYHSGDRPLEKGRGRRRVSGQKRPAPRSRMLLLAPGQALSVAPTLMDYKMLKEH